MEKPGTINTHKDLVVWQKGMDLVEEIYSLTATFPQTEVFGLTAQIKSSAISIPSNIAEGAARGSRKEYIHFLHIALGSIAELETQLLIAQRLGFIQDPLEKELSELKKPLLGLIKTLKKNHSKVSHS